VFGRVVWVGKETEGACCRIEDKRKRERDRDGDGVGLEGVLN